MIPAPRQSADWVGRFGTFGLAWGLPHAAMLAGLLVDVPARMTVWVVALSWMATACLFNARRCGRTHCRFTGPYYLAMIIPVLLLGSSAAPPSAWIALGIGIVVGSALIWWGSERAWGKFTLPKATAPPSSACQK